MSSFVQYAPPKIEGGDWTDADRDAFGPQILRKVAPKIEHRRLGGPEVPIMVHHRHAGRRGHGTKQRRLNAVRVDDIDLVLVDPPIEHGLCLE